MVIVIEGLKPGDKILLGSRIQEGMQIKWVIVQDTVKLPDEFK